MKLKRNFGSFEKTLLFFETMAFITDEAELQALLYTFTSTDEWEMLMETVLIPEDWIPMVHARLSELTAQDIPVSVRICLPRCCSVSSLDHMVHLHNLFVVLFSLDWQLF